MDEAELKENLTLVARKACFGLPTGCPTCLPVYIYLKFSKIPFNLEYNLIYPDSDQIPFVESGTYVAYNNEKGGVIQSLKEDGIIDLDSDVRGIPEWVSTKAMVDTWLADALLYELWLGTDGSSAKKIYYSDLPWPIGKVLFFKQHRAVKQVLGITKDNTDRIEDEIYRKASIAYGAIATLLGEQSYLFENGPTSLEANFLSHVLVTLYALPESSVLRSKLLEHANLVKYAENHKLELIDSSPSSIPQSSSHPSAAKQGPSNWSSKPKPKPKKEKTEEEKKFRRRAKYFLVSQMVAVLVFLTILGGSDDAEVELDEDDDGF